MHAIAEISRPILPLRALPIVTTRLKGVVTGPRRPVTDPAILGSLLGLHAVRHPRILDASFGSGRIWLGLPYQPVRLDVRPHLEVDIVGDWCDLPVLFGPSSFDCVVWDPPHVTDAGDGIVGRGEWAERYGTHHVASGPSIAPLFEPFLAAAAAVLEPRTGIVLAKIADQIHSGGLQLNFLDLVVAARAAGFVVCDYTVKVRAAGMTDPKRVRQYHLPKAWSFWVALRHGAACRGPGIALERVCPGCDRIFKPKRNAQTCGDRCRQRVHRRP